MWAWNPQTEWSAQVYGQRLCTDPTGKWSAAQLPVVCLMCTSVRPAQMLLCKVQSETRHHDTHEPTLPYHAEG